MPTPSPTAGVAPTAAGRWGSCGLAYLTGLPEGPPDFSRSNVLVRAERLAEDAATLLTGRAGLLGLRRGGRVSAGRATRLLAAADGWCAITLSRPDDVVAVPALVQADADAVAKDHWPVLARWAAARPTSEIIERTELLDIPAAALGEIAAAPPRLRRIGAARHVRDGLLVADLSSMWAGPLCGSLLARTGATVVKVESPQRPDGTRSGSRAFFDWINGHKLSYCLDFDRQAQDLRDLLAVSDVVIEGSRPAALARRGLGPDQIAPRAGRIWLRISGYGERSGRPAFGDDAAVAGGLVGNPAGSPGDGPVFCGDAIADPLSGLEAARAVAQSLRRGGGELIDVSMAAVAATYAALPTEASASAQASLPPQAPVPGRLAAELGADNDTVRRIVSHRRRLSC